MGSGAGDGGGTGGEEPGAAAVAAAEATAAAAGAQSAVDVGVVGQDDADAAAAVAFGAQAASDTSPESTGPVGIGPAADISSAISKGKAAVAAQSLMSVAEPSGKQTVSGPTGPGFGAGFNDSTNTSALNTAGDLDFGADTVAKGLSNFGLAGGKSGFDITGSTPTSETANRGLTNISFLDEAKKNFSKPLAALSIPLAVVSSLITTANDRGDRSPLGEDNEPDQGSADGGEQLPKEPTTPTPPPTPKQKPTTPVKQKRAGLGSTTGLGGRGGALRQSQGSVLTLGFAEKTRKTLLGI